MIEPRRTSLLALQSQGLGAGGLALWVVSTADHLAFCPYWQVWSKAFPGGTSSLSRDGFQLGVSGRLAGHVVRYHGWCLLPPFGPY